MISRIPSRWLRMVVGCCIGVVVLVVVYAGWAGIHRYRRLGRVLDQRIEKLRSAQSRLERPDELGDRMVSLERQLRTARKRFPRAEGFIAMLDKLENVARSAGIDDRRILEFSREGLIRQGRSDTAPVKRLEVRARFDAISWESTVELLWRFDRLQRVVNVKSLRISRERSHGTQAGLDVQLTFEVYLLTPANPPVNADR